MPQMGDYGGLMGLKQKNVVIFSLYSLTIIHTHDIFCSKVVHYVNVRSLHQEKYAKKQNFYMILFTSGELTLSLATVLKCHSYPIYF